MPTKSYEIKSTASTGEVYTSSTLYSNYQNSPKVNGKIRLRANPMQYYKVSATKMAVVSAPNGNHYAPRGAGGQCEPSSIPGFTWDPLVNQALARFRGRLRKGSASMGVTLASWKQSRDMIVNRSRHLAKTLDASYDALSRNERGLDRLKRQREPLANQVLETEFGWMPLFSDLYASLNTVCQDGIPPEWVRSRTTGLVSVSLGPAIESPPVPNGSRVWYGEARVTLGAQCSISNPNLWLLNRLGLINPGTVIWDLIPWSFVVNMFVNVNAIIGQVTDEVGLTLTDISNTRTLTTTFREMRISDGSRGTCEGIYGGKWKDRTVGSLPTVSWQVKVPNVNWELAAIASSLVVQKMQRLNRLIRVL